MAKQRTKEEVEIAVPIGLLWEKMLIVPVVGILDSRRTQILMEDMLESIQLHKAKVLILDVLGVAAVDSAVANHIIKITKATKLMGCECIISGISPAISETMVSLGIEIEGVETTSALSDALELAFSRVGYHIVKKEN
ncbi:STAS domain-containing protein [candidate division KSB1 bacterium]|nr:MAG: STAS domain-containing protein [candidate division KSB1 bacterium]